MLANLAHRSAKATDICTAATCFEYAGPHDAGAPQAAYPFYPHTFKKTILIVSDFDLIEKLEPGLRIKSKTISLFYSIR